MKTTLFKQIVLTLGMACLPLAGMAQAHTDVSRSNSFAVTAHTSNYHGAVRNPDGPVWSYCRQPGRYDDGGGYQWVPIRPDLWEPTGRSGTNFYLQWTGGSAGGNIWGYVDCVRTYWNVSPAPPLTWQPSWSLAVFTELDRMHVYDIGGKLEWMAGHTASGFNRRARISIIRAADGAVENLYDVALSAAAINVRYTLFDEADPDNYPIPAALQGFTLHRGDRLVFGVRGSDAQYRSAYLYDGAVTLKIAGPRGTLFMAY